MPETWILADPHAGALPEADAGLLRLLERAAAPGRELLILGDLFTGWLAPERFWSPLQRAVLERLAALRGRGVRLRFVVGNRDYLVREALAGRLFDAVIEGEAVIDLGGVPALVTHGDGLDPADRPYRAWRWLSRSGPVTAALARLPGPLGRGLAAATERGLRNTNRAHRSGRLPMAALEALGRRAQARGATRAIVGHFHHDRVIDVAGGAPVVLAPCWFEHRRILVARGGDQPLRSTPGDAV